MRTTPLDINVSGVGGFDPPNPRTRHVSDGGHAPGARVVDEPIAQTTRWFGLAALLACLASLLSAMPAQAQSGVPDGFSQIGIHKDHNYFSPESYEHYDTVSGNVLLTFIDLTLPGNGGRQLQFQRTYNNLKGLPPPTTRWSFGFPGMVMRIIDRGNPADDFPFNDDLVLLKGWAPRFVTGDGAVHPTIYTQRPDTDDFDSKAATMRMVISAQFHKYDRQEHKLYMADGTICDYVIAGVDSFGSEIYVLKEFEDAFGNRVELIRSPTVANPTTITVRQHLGNSETRDVVLTLDLQGRVELMTFGQREWDYVYEYEEDGLLKDITTVLAPEGQQWLFSYVATGSKPGDIEQITTPLGGRITYEWQDVEIIPVPGDPTQNFMRHLLRFRDTWDRNNVHLGQWVLDWGNDTNEVNFSWNTIITTPSGPVFFNHGTQVSPGHLFTGGFGRMFRTVGLPGTQPPAESVTDQYTIVPLVRWSSTVWWGVPQLFKRTFLRGSQTYVTDYEYDNDVSSGTGFPWNLHRPRFVRENLTGFARIVDRTYTKVPANADALSPGRYTLGLPFTEKITVGAETFQRSWAYDSTGFLEQAKDFSRLPDQNGTTATFVKGSFGNVESVTKANNKTTTFTYSYGQVKDTVTGEYTASRQIRPDGTVEWETQAGRTTLFEFDLLFRPTVVQPAGSLPTTTTYNDALGKVKVERGTSWTETTVDGFGRPIATINSGNVETKTAYDAEGRVTRRGYPFIGGPDIGTEFEYDDLGRVTRETNPGGSYRERTYNGNTVTIVDENNHSTVQTFQTFGHPDDGRLVTVTDGKQQSWYYAYDALNALTIVTTPDGLFRTWQYNSKHLLSQQTHPESGTTTYGYDAAGVLTQWTDANNLTTVFTHDLNDRVKTVTAGADVTTFAYEPGSDNRLSATQGDVSTVFSYDTTGRVASRTDTVDGYVFTTTFGYNGNDSLTSVFYPSFGTAGDRRRIGYDHNSEQQIIRVADLLINRNFASDFTYHPSGAVTSYVAGNNVTSTFNYDPQRYWLTSINVGHLWELQYQNHDPTGNVGKLVDSRGPGFDQTFQYDELDRLTDAAGTTYYPSAIWAYDVHGNRQNANQTTYTYYPGKLRLWTQNTDTFSYDNNGNLLTVVGPLNKTFTYTPRNMVRTAAVGGVNTSYAYDADDWRVKKKSGTTTTYYLRGLNGEILTEWTNPGPSGQTRDYVYAGSRLINKITRPWSEAADFYGSITPDGPPVTVTLEVPGRRAWLTVNAATNQRISLRGSNGTIQFQEVGCDVWVTLYKPDGTPLPVPSTCMEGYGFMDVTLLSMPGTYKILIDPAGNATGSLTLTMYDVPPDVTGPITPGVALPFSITKPGQNARFTFTGTNGQRVSLRGTNASITGSIVAGCDVWTNILKPDNVGLIFSDACMEGGGFMDTKVLPANGTYTIVVNPETTATGNLTLTLHDLPPDVSGTLQYGTAFPVAIVAPGQNASLTFAGTQNQRITMLGTGGISGSIEAGCDVWASIRNPNNVWVTGSSLCLEGGGFMEVITLQMTGTYTIPIDPVTTATGTSNLTVYLMPPDAGGSLTIGSSPIPVSIATPGQVVELTFSGTSGQQVTVRLTGHTIGHTTIKLVRPDGSIQTSLVHVVPSFNLPTQTLGVSGTYKVVIDPTGARIGNINVQVTSP